jgi:hypothetical protein
MTKKEFYIIALIVIYTYLVIVFHINLNNLISSEKFSGKNFRVTFNAFE